MTWRGALRIVLLSLVLTSAVFDFVVTGLSSSSSGGGVVKGSFPIRSLVLGMSSKNSLLENIDLESGFMPDGVNEIPEDPESESRQLDLENWLMVDSSMWKGYTERMFNAQDMGRHWAKFSESCERIADQCQSTVSNLGQEASVSLSTSSVTVNEAWRGVNDLVDQFNSQLSSMLTPSASSASPSVASESSHVPVLPAHPATIAMSGCGWLIPFHLGVIQAFRDRDYLDAHTQYAGTSGGAIASLVGALSLSTSSALEALIALSREEGFKRDIDGALRNVMKTLILSATLHDDSGGVSHAMTEEEILSMCNDRLHITMTRLWPSGVAALGQLMPRTVVVSRFSSLEELLDIVAASCFIPLYSSTTKVAVSVSNSRSSKGNKGEAADSSDVPELFAEEGLSESEDESAKVGPTQRLSSMKAPADTVFSDANVKSVRVQPIKQAVWRSLNSLAAEIPTAPKEHSASESRNLPSEEQQPSLSGYFIDGGVFAFVPPLGDVRVSPFPNSVLRFTSVDISMPDNAFSLGQLLRWALVPGDEGDLRELFALGHRAGLEWIDVHCDKWSKHKNLFPASYPVTPIDQNTD